MLHAGLGENQGPIIIYTTEVQKKNTTNQQRHIFEKVRIAIANLNQFWVPLAKLLIQVHENALIKAASNSISSDIFLLLQQMTQMPETAASVSIQPWFPLRADPPCALGKALGYVGKTKFSNILKD